MSVFCFFIFFVFDCSLKEFIGTLAHINKTASHSKVVEEKNLGFTYLCLIFLWWEDRVLRVSRDGLCFNFELCATLNRH